MRTFPRSPQTPRVKLRYAYSMYAQFRGPKFDASPVIDAREQLREVIAQYPQLAAEENIPDWSRSSIGTWRASCTGRRILRGEGAARGGVHVPLPRPRYPQTPEDRKAPAMTRNAGLGVARCARAARSPRGSRRRRPLEPRDSRRRKVTDESSPGLLVRFSLPRRHAAISDG
jgi:hypothetical protein